MQAAGGVVPAEQAAAPAAVHDRLGPGRRRRRRRRTSPSALGHNERDRLRHGRHHRSTSGIIVDGEPVTVLGDGDQPVHVLHAAARHRVDRLRRRLDASGSTSSRGTMRVGPQSAGALPGPGLLRPRRHRADGHRLRRGARPLQPRQLPRRRSWTLDREAAQRGDGARRRGRSGMSAVEAADGRAAHRRVPDGRPDAPDDRRARPRPARLRHLRLRRRRRRRTPSRFARELGCRQVVVPLGDLASTWSALGVMSSDVLHVYEHSELMAAPFDAGRAERRSSPSSRSARATQLASEGFADERRRALAASPT